MTKEQKQLQEEINQLSERIKGLEDEKLRVEGERRYVLKKAQESGLIDEQGRFVEEKEKDKKEKPDNLKKNKKK